MNQADIAHARLANQRLTGSEFTTAAEVVAWLVAVQAQEYTGAKAALGWRAGGLDDTAVERAFAAGEILRTHVLRPTWHFVTPADIRWLLKLTGPRVHQVNGGMYRRLELDEATVGIDPQSRRRILDMVRELRDGGMTVLYTTHYMEEAEELSDRVGIIDQGRLIAVGTQAELTRVVGQQETLRLHLAEEASAALVGANGTAGTPAGVVSADGSVELFAGLPGVLRASAVDHQIVVNVVDAGAALPAVVGRANSGGLHVRSIDIEQPNLEAVFLHLTGRGLRD